MPGNSLGRRSSTNPVRISMFDREEKNLAQTDTRRTLASKPKATASGVDSSHIPRPRMRASSCDRASIRGSILKTTGKTPLRHAPTTPITPASAPRSRSSTLSVGDSNRLHVGLPTGRRSLSADRASIRGAKGFRKDSRPLADKAYQSYMLNKIDNFFAMYGCSSMLNGNGSLKPVTLKMFVETSGYLVKLLDIKQILTITNYVEEVPKIALRLHYPGLINKSWLKTANAMHSWPNVLAWICWLVEICEVRQIASEKYKLENLPFMGNQRKAEINKHAFFSMLNFYNAWNEEKLEEEAAMVEKYLQEIEQQQGVSDEALNNANAELEEAKIKLHAVDENANRVDEEVNRMQKLLLSLQEDEAKQLKDIAAKEEYVKLINLEADQMNTECDALREQIHLQKEERDKLLSVIKQQPMSRAERDKILGKCSEIQNYIHQYNEHLEEIKKELYTMDIKLASTNNNLIKAILAYNKEIFMHLSHGIKFDIEKLKMPETLHPDSMVILEAKANLMNDLKELLKTETVEKERSLEYNSFELETLQEKIKRLEDEIANEAKEKENLVSKIKNDARCEETKLKEQIKSLQHDIKDIQDSMPNEQELVEDLKEAEDKLNAVSKKKAYIEESARLFFDKFYEILGEHRSELYNILEKYNE